MLILGHHDIISNCKKQTNKTPHNVLGWVCSFVLGHIIAILGCVLPGGVEIGHFWQCRLRWLVLSVQSAAGVLQWQCGQSGTGLTSVWREWQIVIWIIRSLFTLDHGVFPTGSRPGGVSQIQVLQCTGPECPPHCGPGMLEAGKQGNLGCLGGTGLHGYGIARNLKSTRWPEYFSVRGEMGVRFLRRAWAWDHKVGQVGLGVGAHPLIGGRFSVGACPSGGSGPLGVWSRSVGACLSGPKQLGADLFGRPKHRGQVSLVPGTEPSVPGAWGLPGLRRWGCSVGGVSAGTGARDFLGWDMGACPRRPVGVA
ncbi:uncharacterized protein LOC134484998 [Rattus norvegicus]|uniref:uncharacterized protein LOC134484998 n=1 Tax=Rattus norvegicus TaxID=10116 RepID=UPI002FD85B24